MSMIKMNTYMMTLLTKQLKIQIINLVNFWINLMRIPHLANLRTKMNLNMAIN